MGERKVAIIAALMILPLFFTMIMSGWYVSWVTTEQLSDVQREAVYTALQFEPLTEEEMSGSYHPAIMQGTEDVEIQVHHVASEEAFLDRLECPYTVREERFSYGKVSNTYEIAPFDIPDGTHVRADHIALYFREEKDGLTAVFLVSGNFPEMTTVYELLNDPWQPYQRNTPLIVCVVIEMILCSYLLVCGIIWLVKRLRRKGT